MNIKSKKEINKIQMTGIVEDIKGEMYIIKVQNAFFEAKKAVSCLVKPQINDKVLFFKDETSYILAVLEHTGEVEINEEKLKIKSSSLKIESADFQNSSLNHQVVCGNFSVYFHFIFCIYINIFTLFYISFRRSFIYFGF